MIVHGSGRFTYEEREPVLRTCWECNTAHERLKNVNVLHLCLGCGRYWVFGRFLDSFERDAERDAFFAKLGIGDGESTMKVDSAMVPKS